MNKRKILIVDDSEFNRKILINALEEDYDIIEAANGLEAIKLVDKNITSIALILLDIMMPELNGIEVLKILGENGTTNSIPVILITAADSNEAYGLQLGAVDFIPKPFDPCIVKTRVDTQVKLKDYRDKLEELLAFNMKDQEDIWGNAIDTFATLSEFRNLDLIKNVKKSKFFTKLILCKIIESDEIVSNYTSEDHKAIINVMPLRDIGKIYLPEKIIFKPDKLTDVEFEICKKHTEFGCDIAVKFLNDVNKTYIKHCTDICKYHHENWDGSGYPYGLKNTEIPLSARIAAIVDVYDALVSQRVYRDSYTHEQAVKIIEKEESKKFDPQIINIFKLLQREVKDIYFG